MTGIHKLLPWSRPAVSDRIGTSALLRGAFRRPVSIWLGASCVLVGLLGLMQFMWIGHVDDEQTAASQTRLRGGLRLVTAQFHEEMLLLLSTFDPGADIDATRRQDLYTQRFRSWHQTSIDGNMVKRALFLDLFAPDSEALTELDGKSFTIQPARWDRDIAPVRRHLDEFGFRPGRPLGQRGIVTWMLYPRPLAVYRPIAIPKRVPGRPEVIAVATGYLILHLDLDLIRERLIPDVLDNHLGELLGGVRHTVTIAVDGEDLLAYEPPANVEFESRTDLTGSAGYSLRPVPGPEEIRSAGAPGPVVPFLLSSRSVPLAPSEGGASQQIALRSPLDVLRSIVWSLGPPNGDEDFGLSEADVDSLFHSPLTLSMGLPRLFLVSERPHRLTIRAAPAGTTLAESLNAEYKRSAVVGVLVLALLVGSMAMVAASGISAARRAKDGLEAVALQSQHLRTPVAAITLLADNLADGSLRSDDEVIEHFGLIRQYGKQLNEIVDSTVQLAASESSDRHIDVTLVDVSTEAWEALQDAGPVIDGSGFTRECSLTEGLPKVWAEPATLRQCVSELLTNAVKHGMPGKWLKVETCEAGPGRSREVRIRVHDRGLGLPRQEACTVLQPHYRAPAVAASTIGGSGLGLTLVVCSVEKMGGELTLEDGEGGGSVFTIHLPVAR